MLKIQLIVISLNTIAKVWPTLFILPTFYRLYKAHKLVCYLYIRTSLSTRPVAKATAQSDLPLCPTACYLPLFCLLLLSPTQANPDASTATTAKTSSIRLCRKPLKVWIVNRVWQKPLPLPLAGGPPTMPCPFYHVPRCAKWLFICEPEKVNGHEKWR